MKRATLRALPLPLLLLLLLISGCGDDDRTNCELAKESLDQCNAELLATPPLGAMGASDFRGLPIEITDECSGWNACDAKCVKDTSCDGMTWALHAKGAD